MASLNPDETGSPAEPPPSGRIQRGRHRAAQLLASARAGHLGEEALEIARLVEDKLAGEIEGDDDPATVDLDRRISFIRHRFTGRLIQYERGDRWYGRLDNCLNLVSIAGGAGSAIAGGLHAGAGWIIAFGSVVAGLQTFSQWLKPAQRASRRGHAAARLRDEGWDFLLGQDRYKGKDLRGSWPIFYAEINKIAQQEESVEDQEASHAAAPSKEQGNG